MQILDQHLDEFIQLYEKHYGVVLDREEAEKKGMELCNLVRIVSFSPESVSEDETVSSR